MIVLYLVPGPPPKRKQSSVASTPTRKLSLIAEDNDHIMVDFGHAIRSGNAETVIDIITNNNISILTRLGIQFETFFRRDSKRAANPNTASDSRTFPGDSIKLHMERFNKPDKMFVTPFHLAIIAQQSDIVEVMLESVLNSEKPAEDVKSLLAKKTKISFTKDISLYYKDDKVLDGINAFHLAGRFHAQSLLVIVRILRDNDLLEPVLFLLEETDPYMGKTPLQMSMKSPSSLSATIFLLIGACIDGKDKRGYTALHHAAKEGSEANCQILLEHGAHPDIFGDDNHFKTPFHRARTHKVVQVLLKYGGNPYLREISHSKEKSTVVRSAIDILLKRHPQAVGDIMSNGVETNGQELDSGDLQIVYNFEVFFREGLDQAVDDINEFTDYERVDEMAAHVKAVQSKYRDLLKNPLMEAFLQIKWQLIKRLFYLNLFSYAFFLLMLTTMVLIGGKMSLCDPYHSDILEKFGCSDISHKLNTHNFWEILSAHLESKSGQERALGCTFLATFICSSIGLLFLIAREVSQAVVNFSFYIWSPENWLEAGIISLSVIYMILLDFQKDYAVHFGAWAVFLGWWELTLLLGRIPTIGIFIYLSVSVMKVLAIFFIVYSPVLVAFALIFHILLPSNETFIDPLTSLLKVLAMMTGEFDLQDNFLTNSSANDFGTGSTQVAFVLFLLVGNIVIANLLIGLTVNKTEELFKKAGVLRLEKTVNQVHGLGLFFRHRSILARINKLTKTTNLFCYLDSLLNDRRKGNSDKASPWKICVLPHSYAQMKTSSKGRSFLDSQSNNDTSSVSFERSYYAYLYDDLEGCFKQKLPFTIPAWVIANTLTMLRDQKLHNDTQNAQEIEKEAANERSLEKLQRAIDPDKELKRSSSGVTPQDLADALSSNVKSVESRRISIAPPLPNIHEESTDFGTKDEKVKRLEAKIQAMQSNLQELQELVLDLNRQEN